jgi:hypothetical protein
MSSSVNEVKYVKEDAKLPRGPFLTNVYDDIDKENEADGNW